MLYSLARVPRRDRRYWTCHHASRRPGQPRPCRIEFSHSIIRQTPAYDDHLCPAHEQRWNGTAYSVRIKSSHEDHTRTRFAASPKDTNVPEQHPIERRSYITNGTRSTVGRAINSLSLWVTSQRNVVGTTVLATLAKFLE